MFLCSCESRKFLHVLESQHRWRSIRDCPDEVAEESKTVSFGSDVGREDLGDPDECNAVHKLEANDIKIDDGNASCQTSFVVGS